MLQPHQKFSIDDTRNACLGALRISFFGVLRWQMQVKYIAMQKKNYALLFSDLNEKRPIFLCLQTYE